MYFYFKNAVWAHMERSALKRVPDIVYTINPVTISTEPAPTGVKMDTQDIPVIPVRRFVNIFFNQFSSLTLFIHTETSIHMIFQPVNLDVTAKTVHITAPKIARHTNIPTAHAVVMQVGADPTVQQVFGFLCLGKCKM